MDTLHQIKKRRERRKKNRRILRIAGAIAFIFGCIVLVLGIRAVVCSRNGEPETAETSSGSVASSDGQSAEALTVDSAPDDDNEKTLEPVHLTVSSMGDCTLGTDVNFNQSTSLNAYYNLYGPEYFFQNVRSVLEADDLSVVNMEGTLTTSDNRQDKTFAFKGPAEYAQILSAGSVEAANLANNHSRDYGEQSYTDTITALENEGIPAFGYDRIQVLDIKGVKVGLTGIYELAEHLGKEQEVKDNIAALKEQGAQLIIVNFHWGIEREYVPNGTQKQLAHLAIDEGADLVIGHHPHVLQGIEKYNGKYIAYSLGNFCFGGNSNPSDKDTMIFQQTFTVSENGVEDDDNINIIPCSLSSTAGCNDYCPRILDGEEKQRVLDKIEKYSQEL